MSSSLSALLESAFPLKSLPQLMDCSRNPGASDYAVRSVRTREFAAVCNGNGPLFDTAWAVMEAHAPELWAGAEPVGNESIHLSAVEASSGSAEHTPYIWNLGEPLNSFVIEEADAWAVGFSKLVAAADAAKLRSLREQYLNERTTSPGLFSGWDGMQVSDGTRKAVIYMRDPTPYENESGIVKF